MPIDYYTGYKWPERVVLDIQNYICHSDMLSKANMSTRIIIQKTTHVSVAEGLVFSL